MCTSGRPDKYSSLIVAVIGKSSRRSVGMTKAEILKREILSQYKSVRQFAIEMQIPYSTLVTALDRGIEGMAYGTVIKMCDKLNLNPVDFTSLEKGASLGEKILENRVMQYYVKLNKTGRKKILEMMDDYVQLEKYQIKE
jgi:hypothetical protein